MESSATFTAPEASISALLSAIDTIEWSARHTWNAYSLRKFNIGYESGDEPLSITHKLASQTLARIAAPGATLGITIYAREAETGL